MNMLDTEQRKKNMSVEAYKKQILKTNGRKKWTIDIKKMNSWQNKE